MRVTYNWKNIILILAKPKACVASCLLNPAPPAKPQPRGSRFFFTLNLPTALDAIPGALTPDGSAHLPRNLADGYKVLALVADDNKENLHVLSQMLENIGVEVITVENGQQAVEATLANKPSIVFMDIWMPILDGLEATKQILLNCDEDDRPKMVAVSASVLAHERQRYFDAGFDDFVAKPVDAQRVYECLASLLHVEYEYDDDDLQSIDFDQIVLPEKLFLRLKEAAELGEMGALRELSDEVRHLGEHGHLLAEQLATFTRNLDMEGIFNILGTIKHE